MHLLVGHTQQLTRYIFKCPDLIVGMHVFSFKHIPVVVGNGVKMKTWCFSCQTLLFVLVYCCTVRQLWPEVPLSLIIHLRVSNAIWIQGAGSLAFAPCTSPLSIPWVRFNPRTFEGILFAGRPRVRVCVRVFISLLKPGEARLVYLQG